MEKESRNPSRKVLLVLPPPKEGFRYFKIKCPPLGLLSIATYLKQNLPGTDIKILDGEVTDERYIYETVRSWGADIVGMGAHLLNYENCLSLGRIAKEKGSSVFIGGHHATLIWDRILRNRDFVDGIVKGDGEKAFLEIVQGKPFGEIKNLAYREGGRIIENRRVNLDLDTLPSPDYGIIDDLNLYVNHDLRKKRLFDIYAQKGCLWREKTGGCLFCSRQDIGYRTRNPETVWKEIADLGQTYSADLVWEISDSFTSDRRYLNEFCRHKPHLETPPLRIYSRSTDIDRKVAGMLREMNVAEVTIGMESGDRGCLERIGKGTTPESNIEAVKILNDFGIEVIPNIVFGHPGETKDSMKRTISHLEQIAAIGNVFTVSLHIMHPYPCSKMFEMMMQIPELRKKYALTDVFDLEELDKEWINNFCKVSYEQVREYAKSVDFFKYPIIAGMKL